VVSDEEVELVEGWVWVVLALGTLERMHAINERLHAVHILGLPGRSMIRDANFMRLVNG
jgi:hypothetical protein